MFVLLAPERWYKGRDGVRARALVTPPPPKPLFRVLELQQVTVIGNLAGMLISVWVLPTVRSIRCRREDKLAI